MSSAADAPKFWARFSSHKPAGRKDVINQSVDDTVDDMVVPVLGGFVTAGNSVGLMLAETDVLFTPARFGVEAGFAVGLSLVIGADRMLLPSPRMAWWPGSQATE